MVKTALTNHNNPDPLLFQESLLSWFDQYKRDLPWRRTRDPYAIFVSEMMLQQTQVKTVIPYYERFLQELPDWESLAKAKEEKVLKLWEGLGYYRRARNLRAAAQKIIRDYAGRLPDTMEGILEIPGVGPYSAGAVLSIAYQKPYPVVDGNVIRVFSRLFLIKGNLKTGEGHKKVWEWAEKLVSRQRPGDFNQAVMELGATLCLSENPQCLLCPLLNRCPAAQGGLQSVFPHALKPSATVEVPMSALFIERKGKVLVKKRSQNEKWLKGMWEFPSAGGKNFEEARRKLAGDLKVRARRKPMLEVRHQITRHKIRLRLFGASAPRRLPLSGGFQWVALSRLQKLPFASAQGKLREWLLLNRG